MFEYIKTAAAAKKHEPGKEQHLLITRTSGHPRLHCIKHMLVILTLIHHKYTINKFALWILYFQMRRQCCCCCFTYIRTESFQGMFLSFWFYKQPCVVEMFFLSRTENKSGSEIFTMLESKTDDLTRTNSHFDLVKDRAYNFNIHVDNGATRSINETTSVPA